MNLLARDLNITICNSLTFTPNILLSFDFQPKSNAIILPNHHWHKGCLDHLNHRNPINTPIQEP